jgi:hypothetical protein
MNSLVPVIVHRDTWVTITAEWWTIPAIELTIWALASACVLLWLSRRKWKRKAMDIGGVKLM